jgi:hypothetical protein
MKTTKAYFVGGNKGIQQRSFKKLPDAKKFAGLLTKSTGVKRIPIRTVTYKPAPSYYDNKKNFPSMKKRQSGWI